MLAKEALRAKQAAKAKAAPKPPMPGQPGWRAPGRGCAPLPPGFNAGKYLALNPDVAPLAKRRPHGAATHYSCHGAREKRRFAGFGGTRPGYLSGIFSNWNQS
jgi:hypothetical protein